MIVPIHPSWHEVLASEFIKPYWESLMEFVREEYTHNQCFPEYKNIFRAFDATPFDRVKVVILGQDPYHTRGAATWLSFSVPSDSKTQPSLMNIFKELESDTGIRRMNTDLSDWADQGVLLLNSVLTVREGEPASHKNIWWEIFTDQVIHTLSERKTRVVFVLWGNYAIAKKSLIDTQKHLIISSPHPSPFSAHNGFFWSKPFSMINQLLKSKWEEPLRW